jgi:hypothetical protein
MLISPLNISPLGGGGISAAPFADTYSLYLNGTDESGNIDSTQSALSATTVGTISLWAKLTNATGGINQMLVGFGDTNANTNIQMRQLSLNTLDFTFVLAGVVKFSIRTDANELTSGVRSNIIFVQDGVTPKIYVDGVLPAQTVAIDGDRTLWFADAPLMDNGRIGSVDKDSGGGEFFLDGNVSNLLFLNAAASAADALNIYNGGNPKDESGRANGVSYITMNNSNDNFNSDVVNEWRFYDSIGSNNSDTINCELASRETDTP